MQLVVLQILLLTVNFVICLFVIYRYTDKSLFSNAIDDNKTKIAKSDALRLLVDLAKSKDQRVQRNATGALLNMTHTRKSSTMKAFVLTAAY